MRASGVKLLGKRRFGSGNVNISVDQSILHQGIEYLVEIDSGNMAKLLVGQYVLLNQLYKKGVHFPFFLVVHTYGAQRREGRKPINSLAYNPVRTLYNLQMVNQQLYNDAGIPFAAVHFDSLENWTGNFDAFLDLCSYPPVPSQELKIVA